MPGAASLAHQPARSVPVPAQVGGVQWDDHDMANPDWDLLLAARAQIDLAGLQRVDTVQLSAFAGGAG